MLNSCNGQMSRSLISRLVICILNTIIISSTLNANQLLRSNGGEKPTIVPIKSNDKKNNPLNHLLLIGTKKNFDSNKVEIFNFLDKLKSKKKRLNSMRNFLNMSFLKYIVGI